MQMTEEELDGGILKVTLDGAFDIEGAGAVDMRFSIISGARDRVIVDMSGVDFLASIGVRVLVKTAKGVGRRGGLALYGVQEAPRKVLASTGADTLMHVVDSEEAAIDALS